MPYLLLTLAAVFWGGNYVIGHVLVSDANPLLLPYDTLSRSKPGMELKQRVSDFEAQMKAAYSSLSPEDQEKVDAKIEQWTDPTPVDDPALYLLTV